MAEGFAQQGHKVAVIQKYDFLPVTSKNGVRYLPHRWVDIVKPKNVVHLRNIVLFEQFKNSNQVLWLHDAGRPFINDWNKILTDYQVKVVVVSEWHKQNLQGFGLSVPINVIYPPLDEMCVSYPRPESVDLHQLVWMSSPHKGLGPALDVFLKIREKDPRFKIVVFNPGYLKMEADPNALLLHGIKMMPESTREQMRRVVSQSLCLFYPTQFEETFGLVAAEANALGVPVATYKVAALAESCGNEFQASEEELIQSILSWSSGKRPVVQAQEGLRFENVYPKWKELFI
jgi:glycosyltransferase involved in cell wall biosynthesis